MNHFKQIAAGLEAHHLDAVLLTCEANRFYACGFHSAGSDGIAVVTRHHNYYFTDSRYTEAAGRYVQDAEIREANREHPYSALINEVIQREHITRMGYEDEYMTVADFRRFSEKLSCELVPATQLLWDLRAVKDSEELNCMIQAQRITEKAFDDILKEIRPGVSEKEIAARILYLMLHYGAEDKSFDPIVVSGPNGSLPHGIPSEKRIQDGEFVTMDIGCKFGGYCSDMTRTVAIGEPPDEMRKVYETVLAAQLTGIGKAVAGVSCRAVDAAARDLIYGAGYEGCFGHSLGHSVGIEIHEMPGFSPSIAPETTAKEGMVITVEPGIYLEGRFGVRIEDMVWLAPDGTKDLTNSPKELIIL